jgi:DSF synthase
MGVVDVLAEDGEGEAAVRDYIERHGRKHNAHHAIYRTRRRVNPLTREELFDVVDIWVEAALGLTERDLRTMARLAAAQDRRIATAMPNPGLAVAAE